MAELWFLMSTLIGYDSKQAPLLKKLKFSEGRFHTRNFETSNIPKFAKIQFI